MWDLQICFIEIDENTTNTNFSMVRSCAFCLTDKLESFAIFDRSPVGTPLMKYTPTKYIGLIGD